MQPRVPPAFITSRVQNWLMFTLVSTGAPVPLVQGCFPGGQPPENTGAGLCSAFPELLRFLLAVSPACWGSFPLDDSTNLWCVSHSSQSGTWAHLLRVHSASSLMKMLNGTGSFLPLQYTFSGGCRCLYDLAVHVLSPQFCAMKTRYFSIVTILLSQSMQQSQKTSGQGLCPFKDVWDLLITNAFLTDVWVDKKSNASLGLNIRFK